MTDNTTSDDDTGPAAADGGSDHAVSTPEAPDIIDEDELDASSAPLMSHLIELRKRLITGFIAVAVCFIGCFIFSQALLDLIVQPFVTAINETQETPAELNYKPLELFFARVKIAIAGGVMVAFPIIARELYLFVAPGLYRNEKSAVLPFLISIPFLFSAGMAVVYFLIMPFVINFAVGMQQTSTVAGEASYILFVFVGDYLSLMITLMMAFGFAFQLPVILTLLSLAGVIDEGFLRRNRRFAIVGIFLVAAFLTPPDPVSQIALGLTICGLYETSILSVRLAGKPRRTKPQAARQE